MTIQVNIGEAKAKFSSLAKAALDGEDVVISKAGVPQLRLVPIDADAARRNRAERRCKSFGQFDGQASKEALDDIARPSYSDEEAEAFDILPSQDR